MKIDQQSFIALAKWEGSVRISEWEPRKNPQFWLGIGLGDGSAMDREMGPIRAALVRFTILENFVIGTLQLEALCTA